MLIAETRLRPCEDEVDMYDGGGESGSEVIERGVMMLRMLPSH